MTIAGFVIHLICCSILNTAFARYEPNWNSLDSRPLPQWFDEAKVGIFLHWGVFSVPGFGSEWFWWYWKGAKEPEFVEFMKNNYPPDFTYGDFAPQFKAEFFNPDKWVDIIEAAGAKYVILTSKHCEGFTNWPSAVSWNWNSCDVGPHRDLVGDMAKAVRNRSDIHLGIYHALLEWFNPLYLEDKANNFTTRRFARNKAMPELMELVKSYQPEILWSDAVWEAPDTYWNSTGFLAWLYNESPVKDIVITNDRWGRGLMCHHGGFFTCGDRYNPRVLQKHKWENCMTIDRQSWGFRRNAQIADYLTPSDLIRTLVETVSCGGNILINAGPTADGMIAPIFEQRLRQLGAWLSVNGEAIYASVPWKHQNDTVTSYVWYTSKKSSTGAVTVYAISLAWPEDGELVLGAVSGTKQTAVTMLGYGGSLKWASRGTAGGIVVQVPAISANKMPCNFAWVFKLEHVS